MKNKSEIKLYNIFVKKKISNPKSDRQPYTYEKDQAQRGDKEIFTYIQYL